MGDTKVTIGCCLCSNKTEHVIHIPEGWGLRYNEIEASETEGFCQNHRAVKDFADSQCPGCVGGWGDCTLWKDFAYSGQRNLDDDDFYLMRSGICPRRTNGTFSFSIGSGFKDENLSERASPDSGIALAFAIQDYWLRYPEPATTKAAGEDGSHERISKL